MATKKHNHPIALMTFGKITRVPPKIKMEFQIQQGASAQWAPFLRWALSPGNGQAMSLVT